MILHTFNMTRLYYSINCSNGHSFASNKSHLKTHFIQLITIKLQESVPRNPRCFLHFWAGDKTSADCQELFVR